MVVDSPCGLPMESVFSEEIALFRVPNRRLAEVTLLALDLDLISKRAFSLTDFQKMTWLFRLFKIMYDYARFEAGVTDLVICMHPKHRALYDYLTFETIGPVKKYPPCDRPALPMRLDIPAVMGRLSVNAGNYFFKNQPPTEVFNMSLKPDDALEELLLNNDEVCAKLSSSAKKYLLSCYPSLQGKLTV